ncbi:MAG: hypothetical protein WCB47_08515, partial [Pseudolabrys sp.]
MAADRITIIKGDLGHIFVLSMNFVCGERRSTDPEMAAPVCLVIYLKPNGAEIQMSEDVRLWHLRHSEASDQCPLSGAKTGHVRCWGQLDQGAL